MVVLDATIVNIAIPYISHDLALQRAATKPWIITGYTLAFGGLLLLGGRIGDLFGRRKMFMIGVIHLRRRLAARRHRAEPGAAARLPRPAGPGRRDRQPDGAGADHHDVPRRQGAQPRVRGLCGDVGCRRRRRPDPRRLAHRLLWRWTFLINVPIGIAAALLAPMVLGESKPRRVALDLPGALTGTLGLLSLVYGLTRASDLVSQGTRQDVDRHLDPRRARSVASCCWSRSCSSSASCQRAAACRSTSSPTAPAA